MFARAYIYMRSYMLNRLWRISLSRPMSKYKGVGSMKRKVQAREKVRRLNMKSDTLKAIIAGKRVPLCGLLYHRRNWCNWTQWRFISRPLFSEVIGRIIMRLSFFFFLAQGGGIALKRGNLGLRFIKHQFSNQVTSMLMGMKGLDTTYYNDFFV